MLVGTAMTGQSTNPPTTLGSAPSIPATTMITSAVFGLVHLGFGGQFPNWRWVAVATVLGWCCGHARNQAGGIRAGVVTHALAVATWRGFFA